MKPLYPLSPYGVKPTRNEYVEPRTFKETLTEFNAVKIIEKLKYKLFKINIIGVRVSKGSTFNDFIIFFDNNDFFCVEATTEPSPSYLQTLILKGGRNMNGIAILCPDRQYEDCWMFGFHKFKSDHPALRQVPGYKFPVIRRQKDCDNYYDEKNIFYDVQGLNLHSTKPNIISNNIGGFSEGCQVIFDWNNYIKKIIPLLQKYSDKKYSYTLLNANWFMWI